VVILVGHVVTLAAWSLAEDLLSNNRLINDDGGGALVFISGLIRDGLLSVVVVVVVVGELRCRLALRVAALVVRQRSLFHSAYVFGDRVPHT
jgi:hypothetical protein